MHSFHFLVILIEGVIIKKVGEIMLFWKRIEIYSGTSINEFNRIREILAKEAISYDYKIRKKANSNKNLSLLEVHQLPETQYYLYVNKHDLTMAKFHLYHHSLHG